MTFCHTLQIHYSYHSKIKSVLWTWRQSILMNLTNAGSPSHGTLCTHYWRSWKGGVFLNHSNSHKYYRSTNTLVDYFRYTFITFLHYNHTIILIHQHSMDSSHHHPHSTPKLLTSRPANHQAILMYWDAKKQQGTDNSCVTIVPLQTPSLSTSSKWKMSYLPSTGVDWILTLSLETVFTKSTNNQSLKMTAPAPCKPLPVCGTGMYLGSFAHPLYRELKHLINRCDSRANSTHTDRAKVCKLRVQTHFPFQD